LAILQHSPWIQKVRGYLPQAEGNRSLVLPLEALEAQVA
jgi:hypothetical protein